MRCCDLLPRQLHPYPRVLVRSALTGPVPGAAEKSVALTAVDMAGFKKLNIDTEQTKIIFILQVCASLSQEAGSALRSHRNQTCVARVLSAHSRRTRAR